MNKKDDIEKAKGGYTLGEKKVKSSWMTYRRLSDPRALWRCES